MGESATLKKSGVLQVGWSLAANDEGRKLGAGRDVMADPAMVALVCASRMGDAGFRILSAPGCTVSLARDGNGVFHFSGQERPRLSS